MIDAMTKEPFTSWLRIGAAVILIASAILILVDGSADTEQLVLEGFMVVLACALLAQGIAGLVTARRR